MSRISPGKEGTGSISDHPIEPVTFCESRLTLRGRRRPEDWCQCCRCSSRVPSCGSATAGRQSGQRESDRGIIIDRSSLFDAPRLVIRQQGGGRKDKNDGKTAKHERGIHQRHLAAKTDIGHLLTCLAIQMRQNSRMKVTLDIKAKDLKDVMRISGEKRRDAAVLKFLSSSLQLSRRREVLDRFMTGEWSTAGAKGAEKKQAWTVAS